MAAEFGIETGHLEAEAGGLGMDAVRAAHAEHALVLVGQLFQAFQQGAHIVQQQRSGLLDEQTVGRVHDIGGRAAQMDITGLGTDFFFQRRQKGDDVMARHFLDGQNAIHIDVGLLTDDVHGFGRNAAHFAPCPADGHFDIQPCAVAVFQRPDTAHFRAGITVNHGEPHALAAVDAALEVAVAPEEFALEAEFPAGAGAEGAVVPDDAAGAVSAGGVMAPEAP